MAKAEEAKAKAQDIAATSNQLPAHLQGHTKQNRIGNIDQSDLIVPRVKLLQGISEELTTHTHAKSGEFWHSIALESLGTEVKAVPIILRKTYVLWAPRGDDRRILARTNEAMEWDLPGASFEVKHKGMPKAVTYKLGRRVDERTDPDLPALSEFGSKVPGDARSPPAAALTYEFLWWFPDFAGYSPSIIINTRASVKPAKMLINQIDIRPVEHYAQQYIITRFQDQNQDGDGYWNYKYVPAGYAAEKDHDRAKELFEGFKGRAFKANDEEDDETPSGEGGGAARGAGLADDKNSKF